MQFCASVHENVWSYPGDWVKGLFYFDLHPLFLFDKNEKADFGCFPNIVYKKIV